MPDEREIYKPRPTPPAIAAQTAAPVQVFEGDKTDPHAPLLDQINARTQKISHTAESSFKRFEDLEAGHGRIVKRLDAQDAELGAVKADAAYTRGKIDAITEAAEAQMADRKARREHEAALAAAKLATDLRKAKWLAVAKVAAAVLGAVAAALASWWVAR